jgi:hypothetical protein
MQVCIHMFMGAGFFVFMYIMLKHSVLKLLNVRVRSEVLTLVTGEDSCRLEYDTAQSRKTCCLGHCKDILPWYGGSRFL